MYGVREEQFVHRGVVVLHPSLILRKKPRRRPVSRFTFKVPRRHSSLSTVYRTVPSFQIVLLADLPAGKPEQNICPGWQERMEAAGLTQFEEGLLQHLTDPDFRSVAESSAAGKLCDMCGKWLSGEPAHGTSPSPTEIWQACVNVLEHPAHAAAPPLGTAADARPGSRMVAVVTRTRSVLEQDTARAAEIVLVLARLFASSAAYKEAAKACLYAIEACPCLMAELTDVATPDHAPADGVAERWRETDFARTVGMLLDSATRARLPLGRELGEALIRHCVVRPFDHSVADGKQVVAAVAYHNVRGAPVTHGPS